MILDGAAHCYAVIRAGMLGLVDSWHGAPNRWDWGVTVASLQAAQQRHERLQKLADSLTPEQRAAVWSDDSEAARTLRRFIR